MATCQRFLKQELLENKKSFAWTLRRFPFSFASLPRRVDNILFGRICPEAERSPVAAEGQRSLPSENEPRDVCATFEVGLSIVSVAMISRDELTKHGHPQELLDQNLV